MRYTQTHAVVRGCLFLAFSFLTFTNISAQMTAAEVFYEKGRSAQADEDPHYAVGRYTLAIQENPALIDAYRARSEAYQAIGKSNLAIEDLTHVIHSNPTDVRALEFRAHIYFTLGQLDRAFFDYENVLKLHTSPEAYLNVGLVKLATDAPDAAIADFRMALSLRPDFVPALCSMADAFSAKGLDYTNPAFSYYDKALALDPSNIIALRNRGKLHLCLNQLENAAADFLKISAQTEDAETLVFLASCYRKQNRILESQYSIDRALALDPNNPDAYFEGGMTEAAAGNLRKALTYMYVARGYEPTHPDYLMECGKIEMRVDKPFMAVRSFNMYTEEAGENAEVDMLREECYLAMEQQNFRAIQPAQQPVSRAAEPMRAFSADVFED